MKKYPGSSILYSKDKRGLRQGVRLARLLKSRTKAEVVVLNPGDLAMIYGSLMNTGKENALKLTRLVAQIPRDEMPEISVPSGREEDARLLYAEQAFWSHKATQLKTCLHSIFTQAGLTTASKKDISKISNRISCIERYLTDINVMRAT